MPVDWSGWNLNYVPDVFGDLYGAGSVEQAMITTLELWLPSYIAEINRQLGAPVLVLPKDYRYQPDERSIAPNTAQVMVVSPGTVGEPERRSNATRATFDARVTVFFGGVSNFNESRAIMHAYSAAVLGAIGQHPSLGDFAETTVWKGVQAGIEERSATYWRTQCINRFNVVVSSVMSPFGGIPAPAVGAPAAPVEVSSENITLSELA